MADREEDWNQFYWYHRIDLGDGRVVPGDYDPRDVLPKYQFPAKMDGLRVLDVGRGSGFFAFEFERRGADVTATELESLFEWDFVGGEAEKQRRMAATPDPARFSEKHITGAFHYAHAARRSKVRAITANIYDLGSRPELRAAFDLVFCGSVFSHLRDPLRGLANLRAVTALGGSCIVTAPAIARSRLACIQRFYLRMRGKQTDPALLAMLTGDKDRRSWWLMNEVCLVESLRAVGFASAQIVSDIDIKFQHGEIIRHIVAHARA